MTSIYKYFILYFLLFTLQSFSNATSWSGDWHVFWKTGSFALQLEQKGNEVKGTYQPGDGKLIGKVIDNTLVVHNYENNNTLKVFSAKLGDTKQTFFGNLHDGEWITAIRAQYDRDFNTLETDQMTPRRTLYSFLRLGNSTREGNYRALAKAMNLFVYPEEAENKKARSHYKLIKTFYQILDECIIDRTTFTKEAKEDEYIVTFNDMQSQLEVEVLFQKQDRLWKIILPSKTTLNTTLTSLLKAKGKYEVDPYDNLELKHPRATIRTFFEEYNRWEHGGKEKVISTMNLSEIDPAIHEWQAPLLAYYLKSVFNRISEVIYQDIPNDPKSKKPYIFFHHPIGQIVIAPYKIENEIKWQFTPKTLDTIENLYNEMEHIQSIYPTKQIQENNLYFGLKSFFKSISPSLLSKINYTEIWQIIMLFVIILMALIIAYFVKLLVIKALSLFYLTKRWTTDMSTLHYARPTQIVVFAMLLLWGSHQLGLSNTLFFVIKVFTQLLIVIGITWIVYNLISLIFSLLLIQAKKTSTSVDEIIISFSNSVLRISVITIAIFTIAEIFGIPYKTVLAGIGIGGLAFAIAAKDTIANFFGSAIIIADRPFTTGDRIKIGDKTGIITDVGMRSTKIRTTEDTLLTVPNNKIAQEMIINYSARESMHVDTEFLFDINTSKAMLDDIDKTLTEYLKNSKDVNQKKIILTGVNDFSKYGISFGLTFFVHATDLSSYSEIRHRMMTEIGDIIHRHDIKLVTIFLNDR